MKTVDFTQHLLSIQTELFRFAFKLTADREEANDLLQETSLKALDNEEKFTPDTNFKGWMYTIMRNIFINNYRRAAKQKTVFSNTANEFLLDYNQVTIANDAETNITLKEIKEAVYQLPEIFKIPFELYFEGYKYHEIADILSEPLGTIKSRIHFARKLLKQQLSRY